MPVAPAQKKAGETSQKVRGDVRGPGPEHEPHEALLARRRDGGEPVHEEGRQGPGEGRRREGDDVGEHGKSRAGLERAQQQRLHLLASSEPTARVGHEPGYR